MNKALFLVLIMLSMCGCESKQNSIAQKEDEKEKVIVAANITADKVALPSVTAANITETVPKEPLRQAQTETVKQGKKEEAKQEKKEKPISKAAQEIIAQNRWGFSIYDPETKVIEYYTSNGDFLGKFTIAILSLDEEQ